jgi:hypothetical protein
LAANDFYRFGNLKERSVKCHGTTNEEVFQDVTEILDLISEELV